MPEPEPDTDLFLIFTRRLQALGAPYMVTGSVAGTLYGEPRVTHDVDVVVALKRGHVDRLAELFPLDEFYCPPREVILDEVLRRQRGHFNLIHHQTGFKADVYLANRDPLHQWALGETRTIHIEDDSIPLAPLEYVIVRKLEFYREGGSDKHLRDIAAMLHCSGEALRDEVLTEWVNRLGLEPQWLEARAFEE